MLIVVLIGTTITIKNFFSAQNYFWYAANANPWNIGAIVTSTADIFCSPLRQYPITHNFPSSPAPYSDQVGQMLIYIGYNAETAGRSGSLIQVTFMENTEFLWIATGYTNSFSVVSNNYPVITFKRTSNFPSSFVYPSDVLLPVMVKLKVGENKIAVKLSWPNNAVTTNDECSSLRPITVYPPKTDLAINSISYSPSPLIAGQQATFTINYSNARLADITSNGTFANISFQNMTFNSLSGVGVSDGGAISGGGRKILLPNIAPGETKTLTIQTTINTWLPTNTMVGLSGTIDSAAYEPPIPDYKTNNSNSKYGQINNIDADPAITQISASPNTIIESGTLIEYTINYQNFWPASTQNTSIIANFQNLVFESSSVTSSSNWATSRIFSLPNLGVSGPLSFTIKARAQWWIWSIASLQATISNSTLDTNQWNNSKTNSMTIESSPIQVTNYWDCAIEKIELSPLVWWIVSYFITLKNYWQTSSSATKLSIGNSANMQLIDWKLNWQTLTYSSNNGIYQFWNLPVLSQNTSSTIEIQMRISDNNPRSLSATVMCDGFSESNTTNNILMHSTQQENTDSSPAQKLKILLQNYCIGPNDSENPTTYRDLYTLNRKNTKEILGLTTCDIFYGYKFKRHTSFLPDKKIVRIEMIMALTRALKLPEAVNLDNYQYSSRFSDTGRKNNVIWYLNLADELWLLTSYTNNTIKPYEKIRISEAKRLIQKAIELKSDQTNQWLGSIFQDFFSLDSIISRWEAAKLIFDAFYNLYKANSIGGINLSYGFNNRFLVRFLRTLETIPSTTDQIITTQNLIEKLNNLPLSSFDKLMLDKETLMTDIQKILQ